MKIIFLVVATGSLFLLVATLLLAFFCIRLHMLLNPSGQYAASKTEIARKFDTIFGLLGGGLAPM